MNLAAGSFASRATALVLLMAVLLLVILLVVLPANTRVEQTVTQLEGSHLRVQKLDLSIARLTLDLQNIQSGDFSGLVWQGQKTGEVTARIQARLGEITSENGIQLRSITSVPTQKMQTLTTIGLRVEGEADLEQLARFLQTIEAHVPVLLVKRASIRRLNQTREFSAQPMLSFQIDVSAPILLEGE